MCTKDAMKQCTFWQLWFTIMFVSITNHLHFFLLQGGFMRGS